MSNKNTENQDTNGTDVISGISTRLFKYLEVKNYGDGGVVRRIDVSDKSDSAIDKIESGMNRNLNHDQYYTLGYDSEVELDPI